MENIVEFPDREVIEQEAAEWLVRLDSELTLTAAELALLREWMQRSPAHSAELISLSEFWGDQSLVALPIPLERLCYQASNTVTKPLLPQWQNWRGWGGLALASLVAVVLTVFSTSGIDANKALYASAIGEQRNIALPDGSTIYLNTNSQVKVDYGEGYRNIQLLQGEAHFDVVKQKQRPFRVYAGRGRVQAIGTAFTVFIRSNDEVDVAVTEGIVALGMLDQVGKVIDPDAVDKTLADSSSSPSQAIPDNTVDSVQAEYYLEIPVNDLGRLGAGQETTILVAEHLPAGRPEIKQVAEAELARRGAWRNGLLIFSGDSLEEVVKEVSRYTTLSIEIVDPALKKVRIGGRFSVDTTSDFFNALEANFGLRVTRLDYNRVEISALDKNKNKKNN